MIDRPGDTCIKSLQSPIEINWIFPQMTIKGVYPSTTPGPKIENRAILVQRKEDKKAITGQDKAKRSKTGKKAGRAESMVRDLTLKQAAFIEYYTDRDSPTYGNRTRSYLRAYGNVSYETAKTEASQTLKKPHIASWIDSILEKYGVSTKARVAKLALISSGLCAPRKVRRQAVTKDGVIVNLVDRYDPSHGEQLKAIDQLNKLSGDYAKAQASVDIASDDLKQLLSNTFTRDKAKLKRVDACKDDEDVDEGATKTGEGD